MSALRKMPFILMPFCLILVASMSFYKHCKIFILKRLENLREGFKFAILFEGH